jgi:hypothetical protein
LIAPSFASAPLLAKKTRSKQECSVSAVARASEGSLKKAGDGLITFAGLLLISKKTDLQTKF